MTKQEAIELADNRAREQAASIYASIAEMVARLQHARECSDMQCADTEEKDADERTAYHNENAAREAIEEDAYSVAVRSNWQMPGDTLEPAEYSLLLAGGGPAVRLTGALDQWNEPATARLEYQDWFTPWDEYRSAEVDEAVLLDYARCFYFGS